MISRASSFEIERPCALAASSYQREKAIPAKARKVHEVDVLHIRACAQVIEEAPERSSLQLHLGLGIDIWHGICPNSARARHVASEP